ncbi:hypothetical protein [Pseudonocardia sp. NPDC049154]|uniref:hypothetical protein n=1 Tax=Pseudonocardia sp. NPDC049154 TaxID=3155501 RepID=UPI0033E6CF40
MSRTTGTTATGISGFGAMTNSIYPGPPGPGYTVSGKCSIMFPVITDATQTYRFEFGLTNITAATDTSSAGAWVEFGGTSGALSIKNGAGTSGTITNPVTIAANTWYEIEFVCAPTGTVTFWVNGTQLGSVALTTGSVNMNLRVLKSVGTTGSVFLLDYMALRIA